MPLLLISLLFASCTKKEIVREVDTKELKKRDQRIDELEAQLDKDSQKLENLKKDLDSNNKKTKGSLNSLLQMIEKTQANITDVATDLAQLITVEVTKASDKYRKLIDEIGKNQNLSTLIDRIEYLENNLVKAHELKISKLEKQIQDIPNSEEIVLLKNEIKNSKADITNLKQEIEFSKTELKDHFDLEIKEQINSLTVENNPNALKEIEEKLILESQRLQLKIADNENKIQALDQSINKDELEKLIGTKEEINKQLEETKNQLESLKKIAAEGLGETKSDLITDELYAVCKTSLKTEKDCISFAAIIIRLGGVVIDPMKFKRTKEDFLNFITLSGVQTEAMTKNIDSIIVPSASNKKFFEECHPELEHNIPPQKYWLKGVALGLLLDKIEQKIDIDKKVNYIENIAKINKVTKLNSWYRSSCYNQKMASSGSTGDHITANAIDLNFYKVDGTIDEDTREYYYNFFGKYAWENDILGLSKPLSLSALTFELSLGLGKSKAHLGIGNQNSSQTNKYRIWNYQEYDINKFKNEFSG